MACVNELTIIILFPASWVHFRLFKCIRTYKFTDLVNNSSSLLPAMICPKVPCEAFAVSLMCKGQGFAEPGGREVKD